LFAQVANKDKAFDSAYYFIATTLSAKNINEAITSAEQLLKDSKDSLQKIRCQMLLATLNERTGKHTEALNLALQAESLSEKINNNEWQVRIAGFLSTTFRDVGLIAEGKKHIDIAEEISKNIPNASPLMALFIHQEKTYYEIESDNYDKALAEIRKAIALSEQAPPNSINPIVLATSYQLGGFCCIRLDSLQQASAYLQKALEVLKDQETELKGFIYQNLGELALKQKNLDEAGKYLDLALGYTTSSNNFNLKLYTYRSLNDYYTARQDSKNAMQFQAKYTELLETHTSLTKKISNDLIRKLDNELEQRTRKNYVLYSVCGALLLAIIGAIVYFTRLRRKERAKYLEYIGRLKIQESPEQAARPERKEETVLTVPEYASTEEPIAVNGKKEGFSIPEETEKRVLNDLAELEGNRFYLDNNVNLSSLSAGLKINSKYLSAIINKHKGKDINNYINELRINYIIRQLQDEPDYLEYKIAYLSQECGFSTHSKFTAAFKNITGISPSAFINNLRKDTRKSSY